MTAFEIQEKSNSSAPHYLLWCSLTMTPLVDSTTSFCMSFPACHQVYAGGFGVEIGDGVAEGGVFGIKLPFIHSTTSTTAAMMRTSDSEIDHPMQTILDRFFRFRSIHVSLGKAHVSTAEH